MAAQAPRGDLICGDQSTELSSQRTMLSFERTLMSADRSLMALARASLSLIAFGFVIDRLSDDDVGGRRLGLGMFLLGLLILATGVGAYGFFEGHLRTRRERLREDGLLHPRPRVARSTWILAILLLVVGATAFADLVFSPL